ncbi:MAG TPA: hypothetical protein VGD63_04630 [Steroidobacteraceae bacterium]
MDKPKAWGTSRSIALFVVVALHLAVLALLVVAFQNQHYGESAEQAIELVSLPVFKVPKVRADTFDRPRLRADIAKPTIDIPVPLAPPVGTSSFTPGSSSTPGEGSGVNWLAEAHRAVKAYEIRRDQPSDPAQSVSSSWDEWWPRQHHAGDQYKTESGDWIVWISAECYQIAVAHSNPAAVSTSTPQTICPPKHGAPRGE